MSADESPVICPTNGLPARFYCRKGDATYYVEPRSDTIFQAHMPAVSDMRQYANQEYAAGVYLEYASSRDLKLATARSRLDRIKQLGNGTRLLDVGCATGFFLEAAEAEGFDVHGVEFSPVAISLARPDIREQIVCGDVNALISQSAAKFDVVTAFDIIEHVQNPGKFLADIREVLNTGGILTMSTPDTGHFLRYLMGSRWPMLQPMQHTVLFSRQGLAELLQRCGYGEIEVETTRKVLTTDYLGEQLAATNPSAHRVYRSLRKVLPFALRKKPFAVNIGEAIAYARRA